MGSKDSTDVQWILQMFHGLLPWTPRISWIPHGFHGSHELIPWTESRVVYMSNSVLSPCVTDSYNAGGNADTTVTDGSFWLIACCHNKSIVCFRMPQQQVNPPAVKDKLALLVNCLIGY